MDATVQLVDAAPATRTDVDVELVDSLRVLTCGSVDDGKSDADRTHALGRV